MEKKREMFAGENGLQGDPRLKAISEAIRVVPHFPKPGIMFQDITTLLLDHKAFKDTVDIFVDRYRDMGISVVAGVEARGFMFGPSIALAIGAKFVPLRKPKKLPGEVISEEYVLEYGTDRLEMHVGAVKPGERALVIDDLVATGGTLCAAIKLLGTVQVKGKAIVHPCGTPQVDNCYHEYLLMRGSVLEVWHLPATGDHGLWGCAGKARHPLVDCLPDDACSQYAPFVQFSGSRVKSV